MKIADKKSKSDESALKSLTKEVETLKQSVAERTKQLIEKQGSLDHLQDQVTNKSASSDSIITQIKSELEEVTSKCDVLQWYVTYSPYYGMFTNQNDVGKSQRVFVLFDICWCH